MRYKERREGGACKANGICEKHCGGVVTVFSAPNYGGLGNKGAVLEANNAGRPFEMHQLEGSR